MKLIRWCASAAWGVNCDDKFFLSWFSDQPRIWPIFIVAVSWALGLECETSTYPFSIGNLIFAFESMRNRMAHLIQFKIKLLFVWAVPWIEHIPLRVLSSSKWHVSHQQLWAHDCSLEIAHMAFNRYICISYIICAVVLLCPCPCPVDGYSRDTIIDLFARTTFWRTSMGGSWENLCWRKHDSPSI